ncbi:hypothetical protein O1611_g6811 [Lasiodiplodia mahajangana]|uniref:Uncharacterized protein n=1 Tax=Lasiodiplodia mahajangana TaxID=1108764 RepID=A0ACC2JHG9_9PEZI|nr:hypothetical protein O1611_g6811 [Lasiodiplodia mahajangana]
MYIPTPSAQTVVATVTSPFTMDLRSFLAPLHLLFFSTLLGTQLYQTFVVTKIAHVSLPRSAFTTLQKRLFPIYFRGQSLLLLLTIATIPSRGPLTLIASKAVRIPFAIAGVTATLNLLVYGPRTRRIMIERIHQVLILIFIAVLGTETRDALQKQTTEEEEDDDDVEAPSPEMQRLHRSFSRNHAMSIHLNLLTIGALMWWGWKLASSLNLELK